jgi:hypothetical protein
MKTKWKSKILKLATVDGKIILKWLSNVSSERGCFRIPKIYGMVFAT